MTAKIMYKMEWKVYSTNRFHVPQRGITQPIRWKVDN